MTRDEAINELKCAIDLIKQDGKDWLDERDIPLLNMAIEALEAWDDVTAELAMAVPWCIDTEEDRAYMEGLNTGYNIVQKHLKEVEE